MKPPSLFALTLPLIVVVLSSLTAAKTAVQLKDAKAKAWAR